jgi:hypothetical protein
MANVYDEEMASRNKTELTFDISHKQHVYIICYG